MRKISGRAFVATNILIEFEDGPVFFAISREATLAQVSENLDMISKCHGGQPLPSMCSSKRNKECERSYPAQQPRSPRYRIEFPANEEAAIRIMQTVMVHSQP